MTSSPPRLLTPRFIIILSVFLFLTCIGFPAWYFTTGAKRQALVPVLKSHLTDYYTNMPLLHYAESYLNKSHPHWQLNMIRASFYDTETKTRLMQKQHIEARDEWVPLMETQAREMGNIARFPMWLSEECFKGEELMKEDDSEGTPAAESTPPQQHDTSQFISVLPLSDPLKKYATPLRITCVKDLNDDAIFIDKRGDAKLYTHPKAFARRLNALARVLQAPPTTAQNTMNQFKKVSLHLINLDPNYTLIEKYPEEWSLKKWLLLRRLHQVYGNIDVHHNIMHYGHIPGWTATSNNSVTIRARDMQYLLNENASWDFEAPHDPEHHLHFIILVTPQLQNVTLLDYNDKPTPLNAYTIPQWGGVSFFTEANLNAENRKKWNDYKKQREESKEAGFHAPHKIDLSLEEMHPFLEIMTSQLRSILGVIEPEDTIQASPELQVMLRVVPDDRVGITDWELLHLKRQKTIRFARDAAESLRSLLKVVENMPDVMVLKEVADLAVEALHYLKSANEIALQGDWNAAVFAARIAFEKAEEAFFHPSVVSVLYFPDSQKLAVYLPFVLPISITVVLALLRELKDYAAKRRAHKKEKQE